MATQFVFLVLPEVHLMDLAGPDQVILESIGYGADFSIQYCSTGKPLKSSSGMPMAPLPFYETIAFNEGDYLIIPGSEVSYLLSDAFRKDQALFQWIKDVYEQKVKICSVCAGAFVLAQCGLLDHRNCTTHFKRTTQLQKLFPKTKVQENILFSEDNGIYTSAGIASGIDLALFIVEELKGPNFAHKVAREMVVYNRRTGKEKQQSELMLYRNHIHVGIHKVQDWINENIHEKNFLGQLADLACMSDRNFTRVFKKETGLTVNEYITKVRKEKIKEYIKQPDLSRKQIATKIGLHSERQLSRLMQEI